MWHRHIQRHFKLLGIGLQCCICSVENTSEKWKSYNGLDSECELTPTTAHPTVKPDPPSNVTAWQLEGQETRIKVTWNLPVSWKHLSHFYKLSFELKYRPLNSSFHYEQVSNWSYSFHISEFFTAFPPFTLSPYNAFFVFGPFVLKHSDQRIDVLLQIVLFVFVDAVAEDEGSVLWHHHRCVAWRWLSDPTKSTGWIWRSVEWLECRCLCSQLDRWMPARTCTQQIIRVPLLVWCMFIQRVEVKNSLDSHS